MNPITVKAPFSPVGLVLLVVVTPITLLGVANAQDLTARIVLCVPGLIPLMRLWADLVEHSRTVSVMPAEGVVHVKWRTYLFVKRQRSHDLRSFVAVASYLIDAYPTAVNRLEFVTSDAKALTLGEWAPHHASPSFWSVAKRWSEALPVSRLRPLLAERCQLRDSGFQGFQVATRELG